MDGNVVMKLRLGAALERADAPDCGEVILSFRLDPQEAQDIEPDAAAYLTGREQGPARIPAGAYLFTQRQEHLDQAAWLQMAIELQKDGLWERHVLEPRLYVRHLFEDGQPVTQVFRPLRRR